MYSNVFQLDHVFFSQTRLYMAFVMLLLMWGMYKNKKLNAVMLGVSVLVFELSLWLVRSQTTVDDVSWVKAMIPYHSIAILTSERAEIEDPRVKQLSEDIIKAQEREIAVMK